MNLLRLSLLLTFLLSTALSAKAADLGAVKNAMKERQPAIEALWAEGKIGENNQGFVEARAELTDAQEKLVKAENADREVVYKAIARSTQTTPGQVGVQRALQISKRAAKGLWLQDAEGKWYRK
jgi:uncharacterized protein YdbL (DUF1318 family)